MRSSAKILSHWFATPSPTAKTPMMETLESRQLMSGVVTGPTPVVPPIKAIGETIHAATGQKFVGIVGKVENLGDTAVDAQYLNVNKLQAPINWGDGTPLTYGTIDITSTGTVVISSAHRWAASGEYNVTVELENKWTVIDPPAKGPLTNQHIFATIDDTADVANGLKLTEGAGDKFTAVVGYFNGAPPSTFIVDADIDWGDGSSSKGVITEVSPGFYSVTGTHTYSKSGLHTLHVGVTATPAPKGGINDPIILLLASFDSTVQVLEIPGNA
jgi:hypothetical protein